MGLTPESGKAQEHLNSLQEARVKSHHRSHEALVSHFLKNDEQLWENLPVPSVADPTDASFLRPKTLLDCCRCAQEFLDEHDLNDGCDKGTLYIMRVYGHTTRMLSQSQALQAGCREK